jgi:hypothetical protein
MIASVKHRRAERLAGLFPAVTTPREDPTESVSGPFIHVLGDSNLSSLIAVGQAIPTSSYLRHAASNGAYCKVFGQTKSPRSLEGFPSMLPRLYR